ncbi:c-type cytochrome [Limimaricola pyoseonensis]|uniref:Cytochrome c, mono-and diheme variants n=1 Tax=Limimaricola pyoseonensis TaxID=521013 RepID=A0A1G6ZSF9_9RHOB|nr:c-type cytochrome [Limimaricola pyoseonensis]SDE05628.1 Cytochrome c, mono-and diheme variants [Limimaricola pyoseonensis]
MKVSSLTSVALIAVATAAGAEPSLERGEYLVEGPAACGNCHSPMGPEGPVPDMHLGGRLVEETPVYTAIAPNITPAARVADWSDDELGRSIREGLRPDGSVIGPPMPIVLYRGLSDDDLQSMVMYLRQVPAVENDPGESRYDIPLPPSYGPPVETVSAPERAATVEYGAYLAGPVAHCIECHSPMGPQGPMSDTQTGAGGFEFHGPWGTVVSPNITSGEEGIAKYSDADLKAMITQGVRPDGERMSLPMPYASYAKMTEDDLDAVIAYLRSLPALPTGGTEG